MEIGVKGILEKPLTVEQLAEKILGSGEKPLFILPFGKKEIKSVGIVSGGAADDVGQSSRGKPEYPRGSLPDQPAVELRPARRCA